MLIPHKVKNKGKYISFHYLRGWKARKIRKVQEISPQIPIHHVRVRSIRPCSFPLKWRSGLTKFPIGTPRPQTNVSASLHLSHSTIISVPAPISTIHIISIKQSKMQDFRFFNNLQNFNNICYFSIFSSHR